MSPVREKPRVTTGKEAASGRREKYIPYRGGNEVRRVWDPMSTWSRRRAMKPELPSTGWARPGSRGPERRKVYSRRWAANARRKRDLRRWTVNPARTCEDGRRALHNSMCTSHPRPANQRFKAVQAVPGLAPVNRRSHIQSTCQLRSEVGYLYA